MVAEAESLQANAAFVASGDLRATWASIVDAAVVAIVAVAGSDEQERVVLC